MTGISATGPDLVVAGAGGGLVGALRAASRGLSVLVLEKNEHFALGNNTSMSTAMIPGAGTRWQRAAGIDDSPQAFVTDIMRKTHDGADARLAHALAEVSAPLVEWMADNLDVPLSLVTDFGYPGHSRHRCHTIPRRSGRILLGQILRQARRSDLIDLMVPAALSDVVTQDGSVQSVIVRSPAGQEEIQARSVLLATNGFGADPHLVREYIPEIAGAHYHGSEGSTGDALRIGRALGAATAFMDAYQGHAALAMPSMTLAGWATVMHGAILVDRHGRRFGDETSGYSEYASQVLADADGHAWLILDERVHAACLEFRDYIDTVESGAVRWADDVEALAATIGASPARLAATVEHARACADGVAEDELGRRHWEHPLQARLGAIAVEPALFHTQGGLQVDANARVLTPTGNPICGLYAAGGAAAGISGHGASGYLAGNGLLPAFGLAFLAASDSACSHR